MKWVLDGKDRTYRYGYDGLSRLQSATFTGGNTGELYSTGYSYDKHGNILTLQREGKTDTGYGRVDILDMSYRGNQLIGVNDTGTTVTLEQSNVFEKGSQSTEQYEYNLNGAMRKDFNKNITDISYNVLNLPQKVEINGTTHLYRYAADGRKLQVKQGSLTRDYVGNVIYENGSLTRILVNGGYVQKEGNDYVYYFNLNDHLGNNNVVVNQTGTAVQKNSYYPFGLPMAETANAEQDKQPYKYNGKEFERKDGLNLFDYGARHYDVAIGRFTTVDPLAEKHYSISSYIYCLNNPLKYIDPLGKDTISVSNQGIITDVINHKGENVYIDSEGNPISFNDPTGVDKKWLTEKQDIGSRVFMNISRETASSTINSVSSNKDIMNSKGLNRYEKIRKASHKEADFTFNFLVHYFNKNRNSETEIPVPEIGILRAKYQEDFVNFKFEGESNLYNLYDSGNFMWGAWSKKVGISDSEAKWGPQLNEFFMDSKADSRAIKNGRKWF